MAYAHFQRTIVDESGNVLPGASVEVRADISGAPLVSLFSDRDGAVPISNPLTTDANGRADFYAVGGAKKITVTLGSYTETLRYYPLGTMAELDGSFPDVEAMPYRLSLSSGVPVTESDVTSATAVYGTLFGGDYALLYDGSLWAPRAASAELTLTLNDPNHAADTNYDVFLFWDTSALTLRLGTGPAWSSATARGTGAGTTEIETYGGRPVNKVSMTLRNGATTYASIAARTARLLGTVRTTGTAGVTEDSATKRFLSNFYYPAFRLLRKAGPSSGYNYSTFTYRQVNADTAMAVAVVLCTAGRLATLRWDPFVTNDNATARTVGVGIGLSSTTTPATAASDTVNIVSGTGGRPRAYYNDYPGLGYHTLVMLEFGAGAGTQSWGTGAYAHGWVLN